MNNKVYFLVLTLFLFSACSSVRVVESRADSGFNLADYETFNFLGEEEESPVMENYQEEMNLIKEEISQELENRGLRRSENPDLWVNIGAVVEEKQTTRETNIREAPRYIGQRRYTWKSEEIVVNRYNFGTVTVELVDNKENNLVWKGVAEGVVPDDPEKLRNNIEEGVEKLFRKIPVSENTATDQEENAGSL